MSVDAREFRNALGQFPTGVAIITAKSETGEQLGLTVSSFNSVSMDPPLILFSLDCGAFSLDAMRKAQYFGVNVLGQEQEHLSNKFAKALEDKWDGVSHRLTDNGTAMLDDALAQFECTFYAEYDGGDHVIFVGEVIDYHRCNKENDPLVFFRGRYATIA